MWPFWCEPRRHPNALPAVHNRVLLVIIPLNTKPTSKRLQLSVFYAFRPAVRQRPIQTEPTTGCDFALPSLYNPIIELRWRLFFRYTHPKPMLNTSSKLCIWLSLSWIEAKYRSIDALLFWLIYVCVWI